MTQIPASRVVNVSLTRNDRFPARRGFGTPLLLTETAVAGEVDGSNRTKLYNSLSEVAADFPAGTDVHDAATALFSRRPRPLRLKVGFIDDTVATNAAGMTTEMSAIADSDNSFYQVCVEAGLRDDAKLDGLVNWIETRNKIALIDSNDALLKSSADATNIAARHKGTVERTAVFYHDDADENLAISAAGYMATRNFDDSNSAYTLKFKEAQGVAATTLTTDELTAITGFTEALGQDSANGHLANAYINIGGQNLFVEGSTLSPNVFVDEIHATDWIVARTEEEMMSVLLNNPSIPYTAAGVEVLVGAIRTVMAQAVRSGLVATDEDPDNPGTFLEAYTIDVPDVFETTAAQRKSRVFPAIGVDFRYSGAMHYVTINYNMNF